MQGIEEVQRGYLDVEVLAGELLAPGSAYAFLAAHRAMVKEKPPAQPSKIGTETIAEGGMLTTADDGVATASG